jgi:D-glycero-alpha-D-manno-heptose-7-phosphate kinase
MIVESLAPLRIGLVGGGTDVGEYAQKHGGVVLNMAINIRQRILLDDSFKFGVYDSPFIRQLCLALGLKNTEVMQEFDHGYIGSGLGSSASATVALVGAVNRLKSLGMNQDQIAEKSWELEVKSLGLYGGKQDQYAAVYGGVNYFTFSKNKVERIPVPKTLGDDLSRCLVLFDSGFKRSNNRIQEGLKRISDAQKKYLDGIKHLAFESVSVFSDPQKFGNLINLSWTLKQQSNRNVTNFEIDNLISQGIKLGAYGAKLCGSGGGGCLLFVVDPDKKESLVESMPLRNIDFQIDHQGLDVRVI